MKPANQKDPAISTILSVLALFCLASGAAGLLFAFLLGQMALALCGVGAILSGFLLIGMSQVIVYLAKILRATELTAFGISKLNQSNDTKVP